MEEGELSTLLILSLLLTHYISVLPSYRNQSTDLLCNQLTGFYTRTTLTFNGLREVTRDKN